MLVVSRTFSRTLPWTTRRTLGQWVWDYYHPHSLILASAIFVFGGPISFWIWLDLGSASTETLSDRLEIVQLLVATIVGGVAVGVFAVSQLPRILRPRFHVSFLTSDPTDGAKFITLRSLRGRATGGQPTWLHVQITNVGTVTYSAMTVAFELPDPWDMSRAIPVGDYMLVHVIRKGTQEDVRGSPAFARLWHLREEFNQIYFEANDNPQETGSGSSAIYSFVVAPPQVAKAGTLRVFISCKESVGTVVKTLKVEVVP